MKTKNIWLAVACASLLGVSVAHAAVAPVPPKAYANVGKVNTATYDFTVAQTGHIVAYYADNYTTASFYNTLSLLVNGVDSGKTGLGNHNSPYGASLDFGSFNAGDSLVFKLNANLNTSYVATNTSHTLFSDPNMNTGGDKGLNHVYSSAYGGDSFIPAGTYVAFEDLKGGGDLNYHDENFVFTNVNTPIPGAIWLFGTGIVGLIGLGKRKQTGNFAA